MILHKLILFALIIVSCNALAQQKHTEPTSPYWEITNRKSIVWDITKEKRLPHKENIEMAGKNVASIIYYKIDENKKLSITKDVIFPQLRTYNKSNEPDWKKYRAYFRKSISDQIAPSIAYKNKIIVPSTVDSVEIGGMLTFYHTPVEDLQIIKTIYPSMEDRYIVERWEIKNVSQVIKELSISNCKLKQSEVGYKGEYTFEMFSDASEQLNLSPGTSYSFPVYYGATLNKEKTINFDFRKAEQQRKDFLSTMQNNLVLETPDKTINTLFYFSKIRASESIFNSSMGLVHSPGGGNYYVGIWANDQVEYSGPFFPYLGYQTGNIAAYNTYIHFQKNIPADTTAIAYAFEVDGNFKMDHLDRGDAAMIAYGASHYALASGNQKTASELWPLISWSLEYCHNHRNASGAVLSESDEMEGRIATGTANLSTSTLYYGGLKYGIRLAEEQNMKDLAKTYKARLSAMKNVINDYFGATLEGLETYKYFDENKHLRHWICLPLSMGITSRKKGTIDALLGKLWTENGVLVEFKHETNTDSTTFWDRATLYALQGVMKVGETDRGFKKLRSFSEKRLLGDHVPYVVEAYPENNMKHLSAESALYCRIITEGLLGLEPLSFNKIKITPSLPKTWDHLKLQDIALFGQKTDILLSRDLKRLRLKVICNEKIIFDESIKPNTELSIILPAKN
ncbi:six-hairpin glycosidase-like protein [Aquimarina algiphila]|uniref:Six-hairpin glycosidase-like protein n=1 Tax=Aquimarina algiphila TaxID=2047982 RepID=A0A554VCM6_9FLAO|nr:six-hairpin glycosidase-like protein [Aquimarina algiphila]TSE04448.1 six-hairpin glycosidase-like protein [Aquimarina algiphila]